MKLERIWRKVFSGVVFEEPEPETHEQVGSQEIVEPPQEGEDQMQAHGGDDVCMEVEDAPEREEAQGESESESSSESSSSQEQQEQEETERKGQPSEDENASESSESSDESSEEETEGQPSDQSEGLQQEGSPSEKEDSEPSESEEGRENEGDENESSNGEDGGNGEDGDEPEEPEAEQEWDEEDSDSDDDSYGEYQRESLYNASLETLRRRRLQNAVATIISKVAEDLSGYDTEGDDLWDVQALMTRRFTRRPLHSCRKSLEKERVIIALDFSGSCAGYASFFYSILKASENLQDVEIFDASNGFGMGEYTTWSITDRVERPFSYFRERTVIFFGDFDGGHSLVELSKIAKVYWFSCEERYTDMDEHDWCGGYTLKDFRGKYFPCTSEADFLRLIKRVR